MAGASRIIAVDVLDNKLEMAKEFGATETINANETDSVEAVKELTQDGIEYGFEAIGNTNAARQAFDMVQAGGTAVIVGMMPMGSEIQRAGAGLPAREEDDRLHVRQHPLPRAHAEAD